MRLLACTIFTTLTLLAFNACEEKKKPEGSSSLQGEAKPSEAPAVGEDTCSYRESSPIIKEAVFLGKQEGHEGLTAVLFRLTNGEEISVNGNTPDDVKKGDKVSVTYKDTRITFPDAGCRPIKRLKSLKKIGT